MSARSRVGVTFWQVFVVLSIIAVVAAVLFPVFQKARGGYHGSCSSNLRILATAYTQYNQDYDESFPAGSNAAGNGWAGQIYPFIKSLRSYHCPKDTAEGSHISYAANQLISGQFLGRFSDPVATVELYEFTTLSCDPSTAETVSATGLSAPQDSTRHDAVRHALNFLSMDGHVKFLKPGQVSSGPNAVSPKKRAAPFVKTFAIS